MSYCRTTECNKVVLALNFSVCKSACKVYWILIFLNERGRLLLFYLSNVQHCKQIFGIQELISGLCFLCLLCNQGAWAKATWPGRTYKKSGLRVFVFQCNVLALTVTYACMLSTAATHFTEFYSDVFWFSSCVVLPCLTGRGQHAQSELTALFDRKMLLFFNNLLFFDVY